MHLVESIFLSRVEGRGFHVEGRGAMSRVICFHFFFKCVVVVVVV